MQAYDYSGLRGSEGLRVRGSPHGGAGIHGAAAVAPFQLVALEPEHGVHCSWTLHYFTHTANKRKLRGGLGTRSAARVYTN